MCFDKRLNRYIEQIGCTAKQLAEASGVSSAAISRYRTGGRTPDSSGKQVAQLAAGIAKLSRGALDEREVLEALVMSISGISVSHATFLANLNALVDAMGMRRAVFAQELNFDASYISRIFSGQRRPSNMGTFIVGVSRAMARRLDETQDGLDLVGLVGTDWRKIEDVDDRAEAIANWLATNQKAPCDPVEAFLENISEFDLNDYMRLLDFDVSSEVRSSAGLPLTKVYMGQARAKEAALDYLEMACLSKSREDVIMFNDMPLERMALNTDYARSWLSSMVRLLRSGVHVRVIHNADRPLPEIILSIEAWIPLYMTGRVHPYFYENASSGVFNHALRSSASVALAGEAIAGFDDSVRYVLTRASDDVAYYRMRARHMLELAKPLMRIMTVHDADALNQFAETECRSQSDWRMIMGTLPMATLPVELLDPMLDRHGVTDKQRRAIHEFRVARFGQLKAMLSNGVVTLEVPALDEEEFERHPVSLELAGMFFKRELTYTYEEYTSHLRELEAIAERYENLVLLKDRRAAFRNIFIAVRIGKNVLISKNKVPAVHFIIEQPDIVSAFELFSPHEDMELV